MNPIRKVAARLDRHGVPIGCELLAVKTFTFPPPHYRALRTGALIATFRCDAPARCGAFVDERRVEAGDQGGRRETLIQSTGVVRL